MFCQAFNSSACALFVICAFPISYLAGAPRGQLPKHLRGETVEGPVEYEAAVPLYFDGVRRVIDSGLNHADRAESIGKVTLLRMKVPCLGEGVS